MSISALALFFLGLSSAVQERSVEYADIGHEVAGTDFDWVVKANESVTFDTVAQLVFNEDLSQSMLVENGVLFVNDLTIESGAEVIVVGPNPLRVLATGEVRVDGLLDVSGFDANDVQTPSPALEPQDGGVGGPGGGSGGVGSPLSDAPSSRGGTGNGPPGFIGVGGRGGESGYALGFRDWQRPGGGGGGAFGPDIDPTGMGPDPAKPEKGQIAQPGFDGFDSSEPGFLVFSPFPHGSFGAETGLIPAKGGAVGVSPFQDGRPGNDFWGTKLTASGALLHGELEFLAGGAGGGGGGDGIHSDVFPPPLASGAPGASSGGQSSAGGVQADDFFGASPDSKGAGGGGGGGALHVVCLGEIHIGPTAEILSNGGRGGAGESNILIDRTGGGGGGGSGGHIVLEATSVVFSEPATDLARLQALGGRGGAGLPVGSMPMSDFQKIFEVMQRRVNEGGAGGPGVLQLHVPVSASGDPEGNVVLPDGYSLEQLTEPRAQVLLPMFLPQVGSQ